MQELWFFKIFRDFWNSPVFPGKIVKCTYFYLNTVGQTQLNLISPFLAIIYLRLLHFRFQCESLKIDLVA